MTQVGSKTFRTSVIAILLIALAGCGHLPTIKWPFAKRPEAPSSSADELVVTLGDSPNVREFPQFWLRNTLVLDLRDLAGSGSAVIQPRTGTEWPMRMAIRVRPGGVGTVEVTGDQRMVFPVTNEGLRAVDLNLAPGMYTSGTRQLVVRWGPEQTRIVSPAS
jgi:hypothetical protein